MSGPFRLPPSAPSRFGSAIDRSEPVGFRLGARSLSGLYGDTLASALMGSGLSVLGPSPLLGRPRGLMALGIEDHMPVAVEGDGGAWSAISGGEIVVREGLRARGAAGAVEQALRRIASPGGPDRRALPLAQRLLERLRNALPLPGPRLPPVEPLPRARRETCDALVIGAGLAGLAAAAALRAAGLDVRVVEASRRAGGLADLYDGRIDGRPLAEWADAQAGGLIDRGVLTLSATAITIEPDGTVTVVDRPDPQKPGRVAVRLIAAGAIVAATGWRERPLAFADNDRPGVLLASAARALLRRQAVAPGQRVLVATSSDEGYRAALDLREAGVLVDFVLDARADPQGPAVDMAKALGAPVSLSSVVAGVDYDERLGGLTGVRTRNRYGEGATTGARTLAADALVVSGGFAARDELLRGLGLSADQGLHVAHLGPNASDAVAGGWAAGAAAAAQLGGVPSRAAPVVEASADHAAEILATTVDQARGPDAATTFVDFGADVTLADLARGFDRRGAAGAAIARGLGLGLGADGGRLSADLPALALLALSGATPALASPEPSRPTLGMLAARSQEKLRTTD